jgi:hypothetical protein
MKWNVIIYCSLLVSTRAFSVPRQSIRTKCHALSSTVETNLPGVSEFEEWFSKNHPEDNISLKNVKHSLFPNGRGLELIGKLDHIKDKPVIRVSKDIVLQSVMVDDKESLESLADDWDCNLALQLLKEWKRGKLSKIYGYCALLTRGNEFKSDTCPPSTAPDCIRHWTTDQRKLLAKSTRGERLLRVAEKQENEWNDKYDALSELDKMTFTKDQFFWALEAVNSRAFKGDFGGEDVLNKLSNSLIPFAAAAFALNYIRQDPFGKNETITLALLALSCAPVILNFISETFNLRKMDAVLLPLIDSANHMETAGSTIEFDPIKGEFTVSSERNCIVDEPDGKRQLYISYGSKRDTELLLNYGFLSNIAFDASLSDDERRTTLAQEFHARSI